MTNERTSSMPVLRIRTTRGTVSNSARNRMQEVRDTDCRQRNNERCSLRASRRWYSEIHRTRHAWTPGRTAETMEHTSMNALSPEHLCPDGERCQGCNKWCDPNVCWCGTELSKHDFEEHSFVPIGCECGRVHQRESIDANNE